MKKRISLILTVISICFFVITAIYPLSFLTSKQNGLGNDNAYAQELKGIDLSELDKPEEKRYYHSSIISNFRPDQLEVTLTKKASVSLKTYFPEDFAEIGCIKIEDLTINTTKNVQYSLKNGEQPQIYNRKLLLTLDCNSKQKLLQFRDTLYLREDVNRVSYLNNFNFLA